MEGWKDAAKEDYLAVKRESETMVTLFRLGGGGSRREGEGHRNGAAGIYRACFLLLLTLQEPPWYTGLVGDADNFGQTETMGSDETILTDTVCRAPAKQ